MPYIVRRTQGETAKTFTAIFEGHAPGKALVKSVPNLDVSGANGVAVLLVETTEGTDVIVCAPDGAAVCSEPAKQKAPVVFYFDWFSSQLERCGNRIKAIKHNV